MAAESAYELLKKGKKLLASRNPAQAAVVLERAKRLEPNKASIRETLAQAYYNCGKYQLAAEEFRGVLKIHPTDAYAHFGLGLCLNHLGETKKAVGHLKMAATMEPANEDYQKALSKLTGGAKAKQGRMVEKKESIEVSTYAGYKGEELPRQFKLKGRKFTIVQVDKSWREENKKTRKRKTFFRVLTDKGEVFDISYDDKLDKWLLERELKDK